MKNVIICVDKLLIMGEKPYAHFGILVKNIFYPHHLIGYSR
jgi:hypothetical protein